MNDISNGRLNGRGVVGWGAAGIAAIIAALSLILQWTVTPLERRMDRLEMDINRIRDLAAGPAIKRLEDRMDRLEGSVRGPR